MPDPSTPVRALTGYKGGDDASGGGGRARSQVISDQVDAIAGGPAHPAAQAASAPITSTPKPHPSSYAPSGDSGPRVYGSPIEGNAASK